MRAQSPSSSTLTVVDPARGPFKYSVKIDDPLSLLSDQHAALRTCVGRALDLWGTYISGKGVLSVQIAVTEEDAVGRLSASSSTGHYVGACKSLPNCRVAQDQAIHRLRTGDDNPIAPGGPDVRVLVTPRFWRDTLWMDPDPGSRLQPVPADRMDAISTCTHEIGHGLGMSGYRDTNTNRPMPLSDGSIVLSPYDEYVTSFPVIQFVGPKTVARFGPIDLTREHTVENIYHYGNRSTPNQHGGKLMNGVTLYMGRRYAISLVDVLMLEDLGVPIRQRPAE